MIGFNIGSRIRFERIAHKTTKSRVADTEKAGSMGQITKFSHDRAKNLPAESAGIIFSDARRTASQTLNQSWEYGDIASSA